MVTGSFMYALMPIYTIVPNYERDGKMGKRDEINDWLSFKEYLRT